MTGGGAVHILVTGDAARNKAMVLPGGGFSTVKIELPQNWDSLMSSEIYRRFKDSANGIDRESITSNDWKKLREWMDAAVPNLYHTINIKEHPITVAEYEFCILVRLHFNNSEIGHLCNLDSARVSTIRKRLLARIYKTNGSPKDFDERIARIC